MGRRLNVSTPTVINTELVPLDESFYLEVDGQMEQWYYDNTEQYAPNRKVTPLLLTPVISAFDKDTNTSYTPTFYTTQWFANEWDEAQGKYVETEITNTVDSGSADYVKQGDNLLVKKNVSYSHAVTIRCVAIYKDPRDSGVTYTVEDSVNLTTNRTADVVFPEVDIISPSGRAYNPLVDDENSQYDFKGVTTNNPVQPLNTDVRRYPVDVDGTEEILNSGEAVAPIMDIRYGNNPTMEDQEFMYRQTAGGTLVGESIDKAYIERIKGNTVAWNQLVQTTLFPSYLQNGIQFTNNGDGSITINGTADATAVHHNSFIFIEGHTYYINYTNVQGVHLFAVNRTTWNQSKEGVFVANDKNGLALIVNKNTTVYNYVFCPMLFDLTLIYGAGNEPATVAQFEADYERWFGKPLTYEEYDEGSLRPVLMQSVKTTGFNQWDEEWEEGVLNDTTGEPTPYSNRWRVKNYIKVLGGLDYYIKNGGSGSLYIFKYDANKTFLGYYAVEYSKIYTIPNNVSFIKFYPAAQYGTTYNHDICINISNPSKNGTYEPYEEKVQGFDVTAIKGKLNGAGESVTIFPDGLKKAGTVQDEIFVEGGVVKAIKRVGSVDLGSLGWGYASSAAFWASLPSNIKQEVLAQAICPKYVKNLSSDIIDKQFRFYIPTGRRLRISIADSSFNEDYTDFQSAMDGVMLYYELETPETYVLDPITDFVWYGISNGQEVLADTLPWYVSGQGTDNLTVDAMYGENINVVLRCKMMDGETLSPSKAYATLSWRFPDIMSEIDSENGSTIRSDTEELTFGTIVNVSSNLISDALKRKHLAFNWKIRRNDVSAETDKGWGQRITIDASELRNAGGSSLVGNEVYIKGAYEEVTDNGEVVTYNGEKVYDRPID